MIFVYSESSIYLRHSPHRTRRDTVDVFQHDVIKHHGAYGTMQAASLMAEVAFHLDMKSKFGA